MAEPRVSTTALTWWHIALAGRCISRPDDYAEPIGQIDLKMSDNGDYMNLREFVQLLEQFGHSRRDAGLSWNTGHCKLFDLDQDFGKAILGARTLGTALHWLAFYYPLLQDSTSARLEIEEDWATFKYRILDPTIWPRNEDAMFTLGIIALLIKTAAPDAWVHSSITLEADAGQLCFDHSAITQTQVTYGGVDNMLRFPAALLDKPLSIAASGDSSALQRLTRELTQVQRGTPFTLRCRDTIFDEMSNGSVCQDYVAQQLGVSSRTLRRKLATEELSFQALLDECRMQYAALEFRKRKKQSLAEMALKLGYSEHSTFSRAFQRWSGMAPHEYRRSVSLH
ncbi:MAG: helix-turn-helix domain-containing protein [Pseudomonadota bacterium]